MKVDTGTSLKQADLTSLLEPNTAAPIGEPISQDTERTKWSVHEDEIHQKLLSHEGPVLVDLDETLYLRNSTEEFIGLATPGLLAAWLLRFLDVAKPWRFVGGQACRDNWRILLILALFPWTYLRWIQHCRDKVPQAINAKLRDALQGQRNSIIVASNGYALLIRPMMSSFGLPSAALVCCQLLKFGHRRNGKLALVKALYGQDFIARALVITDSYTDADLMRACHSPCLTVWSEARFERAFDGRVYLPGDYLSRVKRPNKGAMRNLVMYDLLPWLLVGLSVTPSLPKAIGLFALFFSMWAVYEVGYYDNDQCALRYETDPKLTPEALAFDNHAFEFKAWTTALVLGAIGVALIHPSAFVSMFGAWTSVLLALYGTYWLYNRIDKTSRIWLYALLQMFRFGSVFVMVVAGPVALAAATAQMITRWIDYIIYRYQRSMGVTTWPKTANQAIRMTIFLMLLTPVLLKQDWEALHTPATLCFLIFAYGLWKYEWKSHTTSFHRLDRPNPNELLQAPVETGKNAPN